MSTQTDIFEDTVSMIDRPLADRMRPQNVSEILGQHHLLDKDKPLRMALDSGRIHSMILWGPPGTGKTTLARLVAKSSDAHFINLSAVFSGVKDIRAAIDEAKRIRAEFGKDTVLFVDEVHRFNKSQQDGFLPYIEDGTIIFIGATTENPSFELNNALLSRARVYVLRSIGSAEIEQIIYHSLTSEKGLGDKGLSIEDKGCSLLAYVADGDARRALNLLEIASDLAEDGVISEPLIKEVVSGGVLRRFDKGGEAFYDQISALHKSVRGSDPDATLYWFCRMIDGGCDPLYIARRVVRMASEDIGNADPRGLQMALDAWDVQERLGSPEGELAIAQALVYMACAPKSNAVYKAFNQAMADAKASGSLEVPLHLRNAPTKLMKELDYGKAYRYAHDEPEGYAAGECYFPDNMRPRRYYEPIDRGLEQKIATRLQYLRDLDKKHSR